MYKPSSALEVEDLIYAIRDRETLVAKQMDEATDKNQLELAEDFGHELGRLSIIRNKLEKHIVDVDYHDDRFGYFPEIFSD